MAGRPKIIISDEVWSDVNPDSDILISCPDCESGRLSPSTDGGISRACDSCGHPFARIDGRLQRRLTEEERDWVESNRGLAGKIARRFSGYGTYIDFYEAYNAALHGLISAACTYNPSIGVNRSTHAWWTCRGYIIVRAKELVGIKNHDRVSHYKTFTDYFISSSGDLELDGLDRRSELADYREESPDASSADRADIEMLRHAIDRLSGRMRNIMKARSSGMTLVEIGRQFGISKERVRQIQGSAIRRIRADMGISIVDADDPINRTEMSLLESRKRRYAVVKARRANRHVSS